VRVATKLALGWGVLIALFAGILAYDLALIHRLAWANQELSRIEFRAAAVSLEQSRRLDGIEEFARKLVVTRDAAYGERLTELTAAFDAGLGELRRLPLSAGERVEIERLADAWHRLPLAAIADEAMRLERGGEAERELAEAVVASFAELRSRSNAAMAATQETVARKVTAAAAAGGRAQALSWFFVALAVALGAAVLWLTIRSFNRPLTRLTEGIREVALGRFFYRPGRPRGDEFSRLEASFNEMVERLGELDEAKSRFLSHVSHELKTPLVATQETNKLLLEEIPGPLNARQRRMLELNLESSRRLGAMISKLLELSRLEAGGAVYDFAPHDLASAVRTAVDGFEALARDRGLGLTLAPTDGELLVRCDRDRIIQVVENLLENAIKFSPAGGAVEVSVAAADGGGAVVEVADRGPGVPAEDRQRVFERFVQLDSPAPGAGDGRGVGLGLAICREIIEAHSGAVWVRGREGGGSRFGFSLPAAG
jgi:two-component system sensor histidine kinase GlrK